MKLDRTVNNVTLLLAATNNSAMWNLKVLNATKNIHSLIPNFIKWIIMTVFSARESQSWYDYGWIQ